MKPDYYNLDVNVNIFVARIGTEGIIAANAWACKRNLARRRSPHFQALERIMRGGTPISETKMSFAEKST
ncbi:hypothetical protein ACU5AY_14625 [Rhizobium sp. PAMB 3174]